MADVNAEPSMEEILSSIKRIIAEEEGAPARRRAAARATFASPAPENDMDERDDEPADVLELDRPLGTAEPMSATPSPAPVAARLASPEPDVASPPPPPSAPAAEPEPMPADPIVSDRAADATRGSLASLSRLVVRADVPSGGDGTLEGLVRDMLKPMLREWLDAHLPELVEAMVSREIARISGRES